MEFEAIKMVGTGMHTDFQFEKLIGRFNGWELNILSSIKVGTNILDLKNEKVNQHILDVVDDFMKSKEILEKQLEDNMEIEIYTPDGIMIAGDIHKVDELLRKNYGKGLWEKQEKFLQDKQCQS